MKKNLKVLGLSAICLASIISSSNISYAEDAVSLVSDTKMENIIGGSDKATSIYIEEKNPVNSSVNTTVLLNGVKIDFKDQAPVVKENRTLVPFRAVFEAMGADISWDNANRVARANKDGVGIALEIGNKNALVGTEKVELDVPAQIINNRTMVPLRFVSENLGYTVEFDNTDPQNYIVKISKTQEQIDKEKEEREKLTQSLKENIFDQFL